MPDAARRNPDWEWDETVLACDLVFQNGWQPLRPGSGRTAESVGRLVAGGGGGCWPHLPVRLTGHKLDVLHSSGLARAVAEPRPQQVGQDIPRMAFAMGDVQGNWGLRSQSSMRIGRPWA
jgi:hypothetical protein